MKKKKTQMNVIQSKLHFIVPLSYEKIKRQRGMLKKSIQELRINDIRECQFSVFYAIITSSSVTWQSGL